MGELEVGLSIAKSVLGFAESDEQERMLNERELASEVSANNQTIERQQSLRRVLGAQVAGEAARGIVPSGGSFSAIQTDTFNEFAQDQEAANLNEDIRKESFEQAKRNAKNKAIFGAVGNIFEAGKFLSGTDVPNVQSKEGTFDPFGKPSVAAADKPLAGAFFDRNEDVFGEGL